jgi:peptidoglycan/LPS O-acetylase OafA/YrhL
MRGKHFYYSLDGIRGIAAILVAMRHVRELFGPVAFAESYLAVDLFFALSGFVLGNAYDEKLRSGLSGSRFFLIRIARLYPLYIIGTLTGILAQAIVVHRDPTRHTISVTQVILSLLMLPNLGGGPLYLFNGPAWSLMFELIANIFYGWQARWLNNRRILGIMILSFVALIGCAVVTWHRHRFASFNAGMDLQTSPYGIFRVFYSFLAGLLIYRLRLQKAFWRWKIPASYARLVLYSSTLLIFLILISMPPHRLVIYFDFFICLFVFPLLVMLLIASDSAAENNRVFAVLGATSYGIYVMHSPLANLLEATLPAHAYAVMLHHAPVSGFCFLAVVFILCWILEKRVDLPIRSAVGRRLNPRRSQVPLQAEPQKAM